MPDDSALRQHLVNLLSGRGAHADFDKAVAGVPVALRGKRARGLPFTPWRLVEHLRIAQWDILEFSHDAEHVSPDWPAGYWPKGNAPPSAKAWNDSVAAFSSRSGGYAGAGQRSRDRSLCPDPAWRRANDPPRSPSAGRPQLLPSRSAHLLRRMLGAWKDR